MNINIKNIKVDIFIICIYILYILNRYIYSILNIYMYMFNINIYTIHIYFKYKYLNYKYNYNNLILKICIFKILRYKYLLQYIGQPLLCFPECFSLVISEICTKMHVTYDLLNQENSF